MGWLYLHCNKLCRRSPDVPHVPMVDNCNMTIVPGDRNRVPTLFGNNAAISGIALPVNAGALLEVLRFGGSSTSPLMSSQYQVVF